MSAREGQAFGGHWDASTARIVPSQSVLELYLLRHGAVESLDARVVRGQQDVALSAEGLSQHAALADWLAPRLPQAVRVCSSDLVRCRDLAVRLGRPVHIDTRLREQSMGAWEGRTWPAITEEDPELVRAYWSDYARTRPAGGESLLDVQQRALQFLGEQLDREGPLVLVTHIGIIRSLLCAWLGVPLESALRFAPATGSCTHVLLSEAGAVLNSFGERPFAFTKARMAPTASRAPRIALSGSAGTGKTTLGRRLAQELGVPFLEEQMRARLEAGFDLHSLSPEALRELILSDWRAQRAEEERCTQGFVADRSSLDYAAFWLHYHLHEDAVRTRALVEELACEAQRYDRILLCPHGVLPLVDDGVRSTNPWTQLRFQAIVEGLLDRHSGGGRVLRVANSTDFEARVRAVLADLG